MHVVVGPVAASSARAFVSYARTVLADKGAVGALPDDVVTAFRGYVGEWQDLAADGSDLVWETDASDEVAEYLVLGFYRLAQRLDAAAEHEGPAAPPEAETFYRALVSGLLSAMREAGGTHAEFAEHLGSFWPGQGDP